MPKDDNHTNLRSTPQSFAMADPDIASLWETKKDADIWLMMGEEKWELHDKVIRGRSEMVDFLVDQKAAMVTQTSSPLPICFCILHSTGALLTTCSTRTTASRNSR
ncbi:hypothetical protein CCHR01_14803 [Colletotrichum chrysophilum]|uniref:Uncharacterized protein n=1 Tax=Colletotrichum chrysophilum TaxID=1836956 RepID=A0AAD9A7I2_9PEZI|nr:hypothetical protein CCHR01_14803 [Colletotrichum chrysophilum]